MQQSLEPIIISVMWNCPQFFNVRFVKTDMCTVTGGAFMFGCVYEGTNIV